MSEELAGILEKSMLFSGFNPEQIQQVIERLQPKTIKFKAGERIYRRGEPADRCWLIQSGQLTVKRASLRTPFRKLIYNKGSVTGIQGLADPGSERPVTLIAEDKVELIEITYEGTSRLESEAQTLLWKNASRLLIRKHFICLSRESFDS